MYLARSIVIDPFDTWVEKEFREQAYDEAVRRMRQKFPHGNILHDEVRRESGNVWHVHFEVEIEVCGGGETEEEARTDFEKSSRSMRFVHPSQMTFNMERHCEERKTARG